jgi:hypothetical protein
VGGKGGQGGEMTQALYAHMNNKTIIKKRHDSSGREPALLCKCKALSSNPSPPHKKKRKEKKNRERI